MDEWWKLGEPWQVCFESAWEAFLAGTIPVGAAVASQDGAVVARGRNRIFDPPGHGLSGSRLAHAEVDALARLPATARYRDYVLYSTLEPCLLCVAATMHATVGRIEYAAADSFGGACTGTIDTGHWQRSAPEIVKLSESSWLGQLSSALQSTFWQEHPEHPAAEEIIGAFGEEARAAGGRVLGLKQSFSRQLDASLPHLLTCLAS